MAIAYVNAAKAPTWPGGSSGNTSSVVISKPTNTASGDVLIALMCSAGGIVFTPPSGWNSLGTVDTGNMKSQAWYKVAGGSEPANYTFTDDGGGVFPSNGMISAWRGCDTTGSPVDDIQSATTTTATTVTTPTCTSTWPSVLPIHAAWARTTTSISTQGAFTNGSGQTERMNPANRGGSTQYYGELSSSTAGTHINTPGTSTGTTFAYDGTHTPTNGLQWQILLKADIPTTSATATDADATATASNPDAIRIATNADFGAATATAYNATVLTGVAALPGVAAALATASNAKAVFTGLGSAGASAFNATVAIGTSAGSAAASAAVSGAAGYFGAPESRRWRIGAEDRTWPVPAESRTWKIESESRKWTIPAKD